MSWVRNATCGNSTCSLDKWCFVDEVKMKYHCVGNGMHAFCGPSLALNLGFMGLSIALNPILGVIMGFMGKVKASIWNVLVSAVNLFSAYWIVIGSVCISINAHDSYSTAAIITGATVIFMSGEYPFYVLCFGDDGNDSEDCPFYIYSLMVQKPEPYTSYANKIEYLRSAAPKLKAVSKKNEDENSGSCCCDGYSYYDYYKYSSDIEYASWDDNSKMPSIESKGVYILDFSTDFYLNKSLALTVEEQIRAIQQKILQDVSSENAAAIIEISGLPRRMIVQGKKGAGIIHSITSSKIGKALWIILGILGLNVLYEFIWVLAIKMREVQIIKKISSNNVYPFKYQQDNEDYQVPDVQANLKIADDDNELEEKIEQNKNYHNIPLQPVDGDDTGAYKYNDPYNVEN